MALTEAWSVDFDDVTEVAKWYTNTLGGAGQIDNLRLGTDGVDSFMELEIGRGSANVRFATYAAMTGDLDHPAGTVAFCFDSTDPDHHGRFVKSGASGSGSWGSRTGNVDDRMWNDPNHRRVAWLELLFQSWFAPGDPGAPGPKIGLPDIPDLRGAEIRYEMRAKNLVLGEHAKIVQHLQTHVSSQQNWPNPATQRGFVNAIQIANPISDQLMMGDGGYYAPNPVRGVHDSGWRDVRIPLNPFSPDWQQLGGVEGRQGLSDDPVSYYNYIVSPPGEFLASVTGNAMIMVVHKVVSPETKANPPTDAEKIGGVLQIRAMSIWVPE